MDKILFFPFFFSKWVHICRNDRFYCCSCRLNSTGINGWVCSGICTKAENDKTGNYIGTIWLIKYKGKDIFVTDMALGSGGIANYFFDCSGNHLIWRNGESYCPSDYVGKNHFYVDDEKDFANFFHDVKLDVVIYSNTKL